MIASAQQINFRKYDIEDGLVNNDILNIYIDSRGFVWLCTRGGLSRYDGSRFTNYTADNGLTNDMINDIVEIGPQEFIVAQNLGGPRLLKNDRIGPLIPESDLVVNKFYRHNGRLLACTDYKGVVAWDNGNFKPLNPEFKNGVSRMSILNDSTWLLLEQEFYGLLTNPMLQQRSDFSLLYGTASCIDSRGRTWVGTSNGLRLLADSIRPGQPIRFKPLPAAFDLPILRGSYISEMIEDSRGNFWIATLNGLIKINKYGVSTVYTQQNWLPISAINCVKEDRQNNIWIGTRHGLARFSMDNELSLVTFSSDFFHGSMLLLPITEKKFHLFNGKGVSILDLQGRISNTSLINPDGYRIYKPDKESVLVRTGKSAIVYRAGEEDHEQISWPENIFFVSIVRLNQDIFLGSDGNKIYAVRNGRCSEEFNVGINDLIYNLIIDKKGFLWAGMQSNGLLKMSVSVDSDDQLSFRIIDSFSTALPDQHVRMLYTDRDDELWVGTRYKGVIRLTLAAHGKYSIQNYGTREGLSSDFALNFNRDAKGNMWVGTMQGIDKLVAEGNQFRVFNFGKVNKIFTNIFDVIFLSDNRMLFTGYHSLVQAVDTRQDTLQPSSVYITKISGGSNDSMILPATGTTRLASNKAQIYFEFSAPQFINEDFTQYSYRLGGSGDTGWSVAGKSRSVYFASLRPGQYRFEVRTRGFNGKWGSPAAYDFIVNSPFWQKPWFIILMALVAGVVVYALYRYRVQQLIRLQRVRNRIATDLHDEIGSNLTNINILSSLGQKNLSQPRKAADFLQRISEEVSSSSQALDDIIWSVNSNNDRLDETAARMRRYAAELFDAAGISYELYLDPAFEGKKLVMEQRRDIYLLYKEAVNNISKHASAKQVEIHIKIQQKYLLLYIKDDGKGFETGKEYSRHGLKGMKERVTRWKGKIVIESGENKGTCIQIRLPMAN